MVFFNYATMQMAAKIVYYGPGLCGKTTNLHVIYARTAPTARGEMVSLETETDRTLFFDLLPIDVGVIGGFKTRLQLYTVPGQVFYNTTRKLVLKGVDGIVFVADSQRPMLEPNKESFRNLRENLAEIGLDRRGHRRSSCSTTSGTSPTSSPSRS
jgi:mutual gliding-motility protein MglA